MNFLLHAGQQRAKLRSELPPQQASAGELVCIAQPPFHHGGHSFSPTQRFFNDVMLWVRVFLVMLCVFREIL